MIDGARLTEVWSIPDEQDPWHELKVHWGTKIPRAMPARTRPEPRLLYAGRAMWHRVFGVEPSREQLQKALGVGLESLVTAEQHLRLVGCWEAAVMPMSGRYFMVPNELIMDTDLLPMTRVLGMYLFSCMKSNARAMVSYETMARHMGFVSHGGLSIKQHVEALAPYLVTEVNFNRRHGRDCNTYRARAEYFPWGHPGELGLPVPSPV